MNNQMQPQRVPLSVLINNERYKRLINNTIKDENRARRFVSAIVSAVAVNPSLQECTPETIISGALLGESLNLSPSPQLGQYYLVPFNNTKKGCKEAQFICGYKGLVQLALRSGQYKRLNVMAIKDGELNKWDPLEEAIDVDLIEDDIERENTPTIGYMASFEYLNGFKKTIYWSKKKMESHALRYSKGYAAKKGYTFWERDFDAMAFKTMLRQLISKWGIMSIDLQTAFEADAAAEKEEYFDSQEEAQLQQVNNAAELPEGESSEDAFMESVRIAAAQNVAEKLAKEEINKIGDKQVSLSEI